jgi:Cysteine protease
MKTNVSIQKMGSLFLTSLLIISLFQGVIAADTGSSAAVLSEAPMNPEYLQYKMKVKDLQQDDAVSLGFIPDPVDTTHLKGKKISKKDLETEIYGEIGIPALTNDDYSTETVSAYPATYDLRTLGRMSPVKNQGSCGSCWAFATYASLESEMLPEELWDFSENNLKNLAGFDLGPCSGGNAQMSTAYLTRWGGPVLESDDPYSSTTSPSDLPERSHVQTVLNIPGRLTSLDNDNIKAAIQTTGGVYTHMYYSSAYYSAANKAYYFSGTTASNHAVTLVGWDDAFDKNKFLTPAPGNGAFIVKNSWGTSFGEAGYFYISYYDTKIGKTLAAFTGESVGNYDTIYQYDPLGWTSTTGFNSETAWFSNIFTATRSEQLTAAGFYTPQTDAVYQVSVYLDPSGGPTTGVLVSQAVGTLAIPGFHTVRLDEPVQLDPNQKFSIVVKLQTPGYAYPIAIEKQRADYSSAATALAGQSYMSRDGITWTDLTSQYANANVCLKGYALASTSPLTPVASFTATPGSGTVPLTVKFTDQTTGVPTSWAWNFGDGATSSSQNPTHIFVTAGNYQVQLTASNSAGSSTTCRPSPSRFRPLSRTSVHSPPRERYLSRFSSPISLPMPRLHGPGLSVMAVLQPCVIRRISIPRPAPTR